MIIFQLRDRIDGDSMYRAPDREELSPTWGLDEADQAKRGVYSSVLGQWVGSSSTVISVNVCSLWHSGPEGYCKLRVLQMQDCSLPLAEKLGWGPNWPTNSGFPISFQGQPTSGP